MESFSQGILTQCSSLAVKIAQVKKSKKAGLSAVAKAKQKQDLTLLKEYELFISDIYQALCKQVCQKVDAVGESINDACATKDKDYFNEDAAKKYAQYSKHINGIFIKTTTPFVLYVQSMAELCNNSAMISTVTESSV